MKLVENSPLTTLTLPLKITPPCASISYPVPYSGMPLNCFESYTVRTPSPLKDLSTVFVVGKYILPLIDILPSAFTVTVKFEAEELILSIEPDKRGIPNLNAGSQNK